MNTLSPGLKINVKGSTQSLFRQIQFCFGGMLLLSLPRRDTPEVLSGFTDKAGTATHPPFCHSSRNVRDEQNENLFSGYEDMKILCVREINLLE